MYIHSTVVMNWQRPCAKSPGSKTPSGSGTPESPRRRRTLHRRRLEKSVHPGIQPLSGESEKWFKNASKTASLWRDMAAKDHQGLRHHTTTHRRGTRTERSGGARVAGWWSGSRGAGRPMRGQHHERICLALRFHTSNVMLYGGV